MILTVGGSPRGRVDGGGALGRTGRRYGRRGQPSAPPPERCGSPIWPSSPTPWNFSPPDGGPTGPARSPPCTIPVPSAHCARTSPTISASSSPTCPPARWLPSASFSTTGWTPTNPLDVWGTGADTRALFAACLRAVSTDPAVAVTALAVDLVPEYDGDTAYADAVLDVALGHRRPAGGARLGPVGGRSRDGTTAAGQRNTRARGHAQRAGRAGPPG